MTQLSRRAEALLREGRRLEGPDAEQRGRVDARLAATLGLPPLGAPPAATPAAASAIKVGAGVAGVAGKVVGVGTKITLVVALLGAGGAAGLWAAGPRGTPSAPAPVERRAPSVVQAAPRVGSSEVPAPPPAVAPVSPASLAAAPSARMRAADGSVLGRAKGATWRPPRGPRPSADPPAGASSGALPAVSPASDDLVRFAAEAASVRAAQTALRNRAPALALRLVDEHRREFPDGRFRLESKVIRIRALCALGRVAEARALGRSFLPPAPVSVYTDRVLASCAAPAQGAP